MTAEDVRRRAHAELTEKTSVETADYLLERPPGGWDSLATKQDLERFATKSDLERFATKDDLAHFATKTDLERFATKDDLAHFATKTDLAHFSEIFDTKLGALGHELRGAIDRAFARQLMWLVGVITGLLAVVVATLKV